MDIQSFAAFLLSLAIVVLLWVLGRVPGVERLMRVGTAAVFLLGAVLLIGFGDWTRFEKWLIAAGAALMTAAVLLPDMSRVFAFCRRYRSEKTEGDAEAKKPRETEESEKAD